MYFSVLFRTKHLAVLASASPLPDPENTMVNKRCTPPAPRPQGECQASKANRDRHRVLAEAG